MTKEEEAGTLVAEAAIFTPIIAFTHVVEVESSLNFLFKWIVPLLIYFLYLLRVFSRRKGRVEKSNTLVPSISALSEVGIIYVIYGLTADFFTLSVALTAVLILAIVLLFAIELWIGSLSSFSEFAASIFNEKANEGSPIPYLENMAHLSRYIDLSQDTEERETIEGKRFIMAVITFAAVLVGYTLVSGIIYVALWLFSVDVRFVMVFVAAFPLLLLKTVISYLYSDYGYGSVGYFDLMGYPYLGLPSLTFNTYLLISLA